jgi:hypothetical protein
VGVEIGGSVFAATNCAATNCAVIGGGVVASSPFFVIAASTIHGGRI